MTKKLILLFFISSLLYCNAQILKTIPKKIEKDHHEGFHFQNTDIFTTSNDIKVKTEISGLNKQYTILDVNESILKELLNNQPENISLIIPYAEKSIVVELFKVNIFTKDFSVKTKTGETVSYTPGAYYQGIVKGRNESMVALSFFNNDIIGIVSTPEDGNIVIGKLKGRDQFVSYSDKDLILMNKFRCTTDEFPFDRNTIPQNENMNGAHKKNLTDNCARIYYEVANSIYLNKSSNITETINWMTGLHNNIAAIYSNDDIKIAVSEIYVWTTADPYASASGSKLNLFKDTRTTYNGDLANFVDAPANGGSAYTNSLCTDRAYSFTGTGLNYESVPIYSFSVFSLSHEIGHILGSQHTHDCAWNGNNTAIDGCGTQAGYSGCAGPIPTASGGTIMSYCHLLSGTGINLANGFGPQPAARIRNIVELKSCLGTNCTSSCSKTISSVAATSVTQNSATVSWIDNTASSWRYKLEKLGSNPQLIIGNTSTSSTAVNLTGLLPGTYYKVSLATECNGNLSYQVSKIFMTEADFCNNFLWTDTGGENSVYSDGEDFTITFRPSLPGQKVSISFSEFSTEPTYDALWIHNGPSTSSAVFSNANYLSGTSAPGIFTSTHSTGALTVKFSSDATTVGSGWKATVSCSNNLLNISKNLDGNSGVDIFPNPTSQYLNVKSHNKIVAYQLLDEMGRSIIKDETVNSNIFKINLSYLSKGNYTIVLHARSQIIVKKFIKK